MAKKPLPIGKISVLLAFLLCVVASLFLIKDCTPAEPTPQPQEDSIRVTMEQLRKQRDRLRLDSIKTAVAAQRRADSIAQAATENKRKQEEAARQAALEAENKRKQEEAARQAALEAENKRKQEEAARQAALEAENKRKQEEAARNRQGISTSKAVDLGLSVKWAGWNIGASSPEGYGDYYAWGETSTKNDYSWSTYKYSNGGRKTKYCTDSNSGNVDNRETLQPTDDVARVKWGGSWRMPTWEEIEELIDKCNWQWTTYKGVNGYKVTGPNGNSIFLPAAGCRYNTEVSGRGSGGYYWSSSLSSSDSDDACRLNFDSSFYDWYSSSRCSGRSVRPVCE